jgi:cAMP-dependent protein kinase regulator
MNVLKGELKVVSIDRDSFKRLLGPLDEILKRNYFRYEKYLG